MGREVHVVVLILLSIFEVWMCYQVLYRTVLDKKYLRTWQKVLIWVNILGVGTLLGINRSIFYFSTLMMLLCIVLTLVIAISFNLSKWYLIVEIIGIYYLLVALLDFFFAFLGMIFIEDLYKVLFGYNNSPYKYILFIMSRSIILSVLLVGRNIRKGENLLNEMQKFLIGIFITLFIVVTFYQFLIYDILFGLSDIKGWSAAGSLVTLLIGAGVFMGMSWKNQELKKENQILEIKEKLELKNLADMTRALEQNRIQIHDMRHHMIILKEYVSKKDYDAVKRYIDEMVEGYEETYDRVWTRVKNLDILLCEKKRAAEIEGIEFEIEADVLKGLPFKDTETSVLFGNLLDNAIEACKKIENGKREILVEIRQKKSFLFIAITNAINQIPKEKKGKLVSAKVNNKLHGYGLKSVDRIVKNYEGTFQYEITERKFKVILYFSNE